MRDNTKSDQMYIGSLLTYICRYLLVSPQNGLLPGSYPFSRNLKGGKCGSDHSVEECVNLAPSGGKVMTQGLT